MAAPDRRSWLAANKWLLLRRFSQFGILALFLVGPMGGPWIIKGTLASSLVLGTVPLTDPLLLLQSLAARHWPETTALLGAFIVVATYAVVGGRTYCSWVCPINPLTDAAHWLHVRLGLPKGWQPGRHLRLALLAMALAVSALTGTVAWEFVNPVTLLYRGLLFGMGLAWAAVLAVFLFDLAISRRGWCSQLCPVGAFYGLVGAASLVRVSARHRERCDDCMDCFAVCPEAHVITPALRGAAQGIGPVIVSGDCTNCGRCIDVCDMHVFTFASRFGNAASRAAGPPERPGETFNDPIPALRRGGRTPVREARKTEGVMG